MGTGRAWSVAPKEPAPPLLAATTAHVTGRSCQPLPLRHQPATPELTSNALPSPPQAAPAVTRSREELSRLRNSNEQRVTNNEQRVVGVGEHTNSESRVGCGLDVATPTGGCVTRKRVGAALLSRSLHACLRCWQAGRPMSLATVLLTRGAHTSPESVAIVRVLDVWAWTKRAPWTTRRRHRLVPFA